MLGQSVGEDEKLVVRHEPFGFPLEKHLHGIGALGDGQILFPPACVPQAILEGSSSSSPSG